MTDLLVKLFIKNSDDTTAPTVREKYGLLGSFVAIVCNLILFSIKLALGFISGSIAITADAFNNLSDVGSGVVTFIGFKMAARPADEDHPFGHGRIEYISGMILTFFILMVGIEIVKTSVDKIFHPQPVVFSAVVVFALLLSMGVKLWMGQFNTILGNRIDSQTMKAAAADSLSDCLSTGVTTLGILLSPFIPFPIDGYLGVVVGIFILFAGYGIAKDTISPLLGNRPNPQLVTEIEDILLSYDMISGVHDLIIHDYGPGRKMGSAHVEIPDNFNLLEAHDTTDNAEKHIQTALHMPFVLHLDPIVTNCKETNDARDMVSLIVSRINQEMSIHDFRMVCGASHTNLIFDIKIPSDYHEKNGVLKKRVDENIEKINKNYYTVITFDRSYI